MRIVSGSTTEYLHFVAVSTADYATRVTGLTAFNVYATATSASTGSTYGITVNEVNSTQMPGVYRVMLTDSTLMTIASGVDSREIALHITSSMAPVTRTFELYRRTVTTGATLSVNSSGEISAISTGAANVVADGFLNRDMSTGVDSGSSSFRTPRQALRFLRNKWTVSTLGVLTVYKEDDSSASWTGAVTTSATADPIVGNDPA